MTSIDYDDGASVTASPIQNFKYMTTEEKRIGGTLSEGETSKRIEDQSIVAGQVNSDEAARKRGEFLAQKIKEQAQASISIESQDKAICRVVNSWASKPTKEAEKFLGKGYSKYRYIGRKLGQAAVPYDTGLNYLKNKYPDEEQKYLEEEYRQGYGEIDYDENFRKKITQNLR